MTQQQAVSVLRVRMLAQEEETAALQLLLLEHVRMRKALQYYADPKNWVDGVPMLNGLSQEDEGAMARTALRLDDFYGTALVPTLEEEGNIAA